VLGRLGCYGGHGRWRGLLFEFRHRQLGDDNILRGYLAFCRFRIFAHRRGQRLFGLSDFLSHCGLGAVGRSSLQFHLCRGNSRCWRFHCG
jgi:hypothetical protein